MGAVPDDWEQVAEAVRSRRIELRMSQAEVGAASKTSERTVRLIEKAERSSYHPSTLRAISHALWGRSDSIEHILRGEEPAEAGRRRMDPDEAWARLKALEREFAALNEEFGHLRAERTEPDAS